MNESRSSPLIGESVPRLEGPGKVTGKALYTDDLYRPGMLYAVLVPSPFAHAHIRSYSISKAMQVPGVKSVLTANDLPATLTGMFVKDQPVLARDKVRYIGEPVAAVAATTLAAAREAADLIDITYEELAPIFDAEQALDVGAPVLHEGRSGYEVMYELPEQPNATCYTLFQEGDPDEMWDECDEIVEHHYRIGAQSHMYMEPCSTLAEVDATGKVVIWCSAQGAARVQALTSQALCIPMSKVRVVVPHVGGGFGGKCELTNQPIVAALAMRTGRPVKMTFSREEDMTMMKSRHGGVIFMKTGVRSDGTLLARTCRIVLDGGAYADESPEVSQVAAFCSRGPYRIPHMRVESWAVYTNKLRASAMRGFGNPQATYASESQIDELALCLGMDPIDFRLKNTLVQGDDWLCGKKISDASINACLEEVRKHSGWDDRRLAPDGSTPGKRRGFGVAAMGHICGLLGSACVVTLNEDGTVGVNSGAVDIGQGSNTVLSQIAAATLGLELNQISFAPSDTDSNPWQFQTSASRTTYVCGIAVQKACESLIAEITRHAGEMLNVTVDSLEVSEGGVVRLRSDPSVCVRFSDVAAKCLYFSGGPIMGSYSWLYSPDQMDPQKVGLRGFTLAPNTIGIFTFAAHVAEVEVDEVTGNVRVVGYWAAHDVGRALNRLATESQIQGGVVQSLGLALTEELIWEEGRLLNPTMASYKILSMADVPLSIIPILIEVPEESGPFGAKGVAEICCVGPLAAVGNAIRDAIGVGIHSLPATPERVLRTMSESR